MHKMSERGRWSAFASLLNEAGLKIYMRHDNGERVTRANTDPVTGAYRKPAHETSERGPE